MSDGAVFGSMYESELWDQLLSADSARKPEARLNSLNKILIKVLSSETPLNERILCRLIRIVSEEQAQGWTEDIADLVGKSRIRDCHPALTAAECLAEKGMLTDAESYLEKAGEAPDKAFFYRVKALLELKRENREEAFKNLVLSLCSDRLNHDVYVMLEQVNDDVNWFALEACERMSQGLDFTEPRDDDAPEMALYRIYREWYRGNRETATRMLIASSGYTEKVPAYCTLSARMSRDEGDWHSCQMMLEESCRANECDVALMCELGNAYLSSGNADMALSRFRNAEAFDTGNPVVVRGMIKSYMALGKNSEALQSIKEFLDSELVNCEDYRELAVKLLDMGFNEDASAAAYSILFNHPGDATACIVLSKVALADGRVREAEKYAKNGVSFNKKNADSLSQLARVYLSLRRPSKAASVAKRAVASDRGSLNALTALLDVYRETGDNDRTQDVCRSILDIDPKNSDAADILANIELGKAIKADDSGNYPEVIGADDFLRIINRLMVEGKYSEVEKLCKDNDHKYGSHPDVRRLRGNAQYALGEYLNASASFASAAVLMKNNAEIWHSKGLADEKFGDLESAEEAFGKAIILDMYNEKYWISNGCIKEKKGDLEAAIKSFNRAIELNPRSSYALVRKAAIFANSGLFSEALNFLELAEATDPRNPSVQIVRMKVCLRAARYTDAVFIGKKLMKKDPDATVVATYARANLGLDDTATAKKVLEKALMSDPDSLELLYAMRDLNIHLGDNESIIEVCREILKLEPYERNTKKALADALSRSGRSDEANIIYASIRNEADSTENAVESEDPVAMFNIAKSMLDAGDLVSAARLTDRAMAADPDNIDYALFRAAIYRRSGDKRVADMFLTQYLERNPTNGFVHEAIGDMRAEDGDLKGAAASYGKAIQSGINKANLYVKLGTVQEKAGADKAAVNSYKTAVMLEPHDADACRCLAYMQFKTKDYDSALRSIQTSINAEASGEAYAILAMIYQAKKDRSGVRDAYQGFLRFDNIAVEWVQNVITALNSVGLRTEATLLKSRPGISFESEDEVVDEVPAEVKRCSERIMRRAYMMGADVSDPGIAEGVDADGETIRAALVYLSDIPGYGEVLYGTNECDHLDDLSYQVILRGKVKDLELITIEGAYVAGGARDVDEAKLLLSYIRAARVSRMPREIPDEYVKLGSETDRNKSVEEVMLDYKVGVFRARMILASTH